MMQSSSPTRESQVSVAADLSQDSSQNNSQSGDSVTAQGTGLHYSREELVRISKLPAANDRPAFLKPECNNEATGLWNPFKHEKYNGWNGNRVTSGSSSSAGTRTGDPDTGKTRLGPQNPGNWIRGCDPKMQETKPVTDTTIQSNGNKTTSELSVPPGLRLTQDKRSVPTGRTSNILHGDWRSEKHSSSIRSDAGRFPNPEFDSRSRGNQRSSSFNKNADRNFSNNHSHHQRNNYDETPEWMSEPTSKFEMMNLGGFEDDTRGGQEEAVPEPKTPATSVRPAPSHYGQDPAPDERSITPDFERLMKDMLNFTEEDSVTEIPVTLPETESGSKSSKWFGGRPDHQSESRRPAAQNDLMQILQRANISLNQVQHHQQHMPKAVQAKSLHEIEGDLRSDPSPGSDDKQAFNKLLDLLSRRGTGQHQQQHVPFTAPPPPQLPVASRPSSHEIEEMNRQRKFLEAHTENPEVQQKSGRSFPPAFSMVPIQVIRNATASDRRGLHEADMNTQPRAITGSAQSHIMQRPVRLPASPFGHEFDMQRQAMMQQEMQRQRSANFSPVARAPLSAQQLQQLQQLQMMNQQLHQLNPSQLQQTRGMSAAQIQQFLLRSAQH